MGRIESGAERERTLRAEATAEAAALYREHGAGAMAILTGRMTSPDAGADQRRHNRLAKLEVERLDRAARNQPWSDVLGTSKKPSLFSRAGLAGLLGIKASARRR
jgi:hypothetical protein